ncbi:ATP-grasp domain-containing protein [Micromonospora halophytica]|uniref:ATP-grasp domain-containing protein n=1 Tax=Micromonospora halophytica TaxID=47864 RepID=A0A1C5JJN6_9ACTN|nr:ATP-grasp domain-containing protein [Micromonospora halophytica]SCG70698.1 ATP-grasp domain-containing protein [Micromonospora halophytica]
MDGPIQVQIFAPDGVLLARPPSPVATAGSRYLAAAGVGLNNGLDMVTGLHLTLPHQAATICSTGASADKSLRLISRCGLKVPSDLREFRSGTQAVQLAREAADRGELLELQFPPQDPQLRAAPARNSPELLTRLNNKTVLETLIAPEYLPRRQIATPAEVRRIVQQDRRPAVVKPAGTEVYSGIAIFTRRLQDRLNRSLFQQMEQVSDQWIVEEEVPFRTVWGIQFAITASGSVEYLGASVHLPQPTSTWTGCVMDDDQPPTELIEALTVGVRKASALGYRGYCSFDAGISRTGELRVIDPNFRVSGATTSVLHRSSLLGQHPCAMTTFFSLAPGVDAEPILAPFIDRGQLVVFMHYDPAMTDNGLFPATILGMVGASGRDSCGVLIAQIQRALGS